METIKEKLNSTFSTLKDSFSYKNVMQAPRIVKVVISTGINRSVDKQRMEMIQNRLARITGQKAAPRQAKKSIATFKTREGDIIGYQVTLRGPRMNTFLDKFIHVALPQTRDFRGIARTVFDEMGNVTIGVPEHTIFPETADEELKDVFGFSVTIVTTAKTKKEAEELLRHVGLPLQKQAE